MSFCLACAEWTSQRPLCRVCSADMAPGPKWRLASGMLVAGGLQHRGAARRLVHRLKYQGLIEIADVLAGHMAPLLPAGADSLVPVARARLRRIKYGIDPAQELARALGRLSGLPVREVLVPAWWWPRHALQERETRTRPRFRTAFATGSGAVLVDDVATSGATLQAANEALGSDFRHGVVATAPGRVRVPAPAEAGEIA